MGFSKIAPSKSLFFSDFNKWKTELENFIAYKDSDLLVLITEQSYEQPSLKGAMTSDERKRFYRDKRVYEMIIMCLPQEIISCYKNQATAYDLWEALLIGFGKDKEMKPESSSEGVNKMVLQKEDEFETLQSQVLIMEAEREEMRSNIVRMEERILELENQQTGLIKLQEDHDLALRTIQDLHGQLSQVSQSTKQPEKVVNKIYASRSSCEKKISQFTNYSLQKNKKYSKKSQSTRTFVHKRVDFWDYVKVEHVKRSVSRHQKKTKRASEPIRPSSESRQTKSCAYTRAQMFAFAPPRCHRMEQKQLKDFVPFSLR